MAVIRCVLFIWRNLRRKSEKHEKLHIYAFDFRLLPTIVKNCKRCIAERLCRMVRPTFERQQFIYISSRTLTIEV